MSESQSTALVVFTALGSREDAQRIAREAVEQRLAACAQIDGPLLSIYRWEGQLCQEEEWRCMLKTSADRYDDLESWLRAAHPYQQPEIIALPIQRGDVGYLQWLEQVLS